MMENASEFERIVSLGAAVIQAPYDYADDDISFTLATLADIGGSDHAYHVQTC